MEILIKAYIFIEILGGLAYLLLIGKPRKRLTPFIALINCVYCLVNAWLLLKLL